MKCQLKKDGCTDSYSDDQLSVDEASGKISMIMNVTDGYQATVCLSCANAAG